MMDAKLFENGRSQAVRLPKECRFDCEEVIAHKIGNVVILMPKDSKWEAFVESLNMFSKDFMEDGRGQFKEDKREEI